jgi:hypothetical protein
MKHTPGPWEASTDYSHVGKRVKNGSMDLICDVSGGIAQGQEREANVRLIAVAPDLLGACLWMQKYMQTIFEPGSDQEPRFMDRVYAAIDKALGKEVKPTKQRPGQEDPGQPTGEPQIAAEYFLF